MPSYGSGKQKEKIGIVGGLGVVTDEILKRISGVVDITGIGMSNLRGVSLPPYEDIDGYHVIRPVYTLPPSKVVERFSKLFKLAGIEFTGAHIKELPLIRWLFQKLRLMDRLTLSAPMTGWLFPAAMKDPIQTKSRSLFLFTP